MTDEQLQQGLTHRNNIKDAQQLLEDVNSDKLVSAFVAVEPGSHLFYTIKKLLVDDLKQTIDTETAKFNAL